MIAGEKKDNRLLQSKNEHREFQDIFLTLGSIANRAELKDEPVDISRVEETVKKYL
jgi:hypothetical protein